MAEKANKEEKPDKAEKEKSRKQANLDGEVLEIIELEETKVTKTYTAMKFTVRIGTEAEAAAQDKKIPERESWLKAKMRPKSGARPTGIDFDRDYKALYAHIFG